MKPLKLGGLGFTFRVCQVGGPFPCYLEDRSAFSKRGAQWIRMKATGNVDP